MIGGGPKPAARLHAAPGLLVAMLVLGGCLGVSDRLPQPATRPLASASPVVPSTPASSSEPSAASSPGSGAAIVWCPITRADGSEAPTGRAPTALPDGLPAAAIQPEEVVYGVFFGTWNAHSTLYAVGPAGASCGVDVGTGFVWWIKDAGGYVFSYDESWNVAPPMWMGCPYLASARRAYLDYLAGAGEGVDSTRCAPGAGEAVVPLSTDGTALELALVWAGSPSEMAPTLRLHGFRPDREPGGFGFIAKCRIGDERTTRCRTALAFVAWSVGARALTVDTILRLATATPTG